MCVRARAFISSTVPTDLRGVHGDVYREEWRARLKLPSYKILDGGSIRAGDESGRLFQAAFWIRP